MKTKLLTKPQERVLAKIAALEAEGGMVATGSVDDGIAARLQERGLVRLTEKREGDCRMWIWRMPEEKRGEDGTGT